VEIKDKHGRLLHKIEDKLRDFSDLDLPEAVFAEMLLQGAHFSGSNLTGADFRGADLYWSIFFLANLTSANFERAQLQGADFKQANLTNANLRDANLGRDNVGGSAQLQGANLTGAELRGAKLDGAEYDEHTIFPLGFSAEKKNLIFKNPKRRYRKLTRYPRSANEREDRTEQVHDSMSRRNPRLAGPHLLRYSF
jgi:hypothetical protein